MVQLQNQRNRLAWPSLIGRCVVACTMVLLTQIALSLVPRFLPASPLLIQLSLSVVSMLVVVGLGWLCRRLLGIHASAPAFVFFTVLFIWCFYLLIIRKGVSLVMDFVFNGEAVLLITGLYRLQASRRNKKNNIVKVDFIRSIEEGDCPAPQQHPPSHFLSRNLFPGGGLDIARSAKYT